MTSPVKPLDRTPKQMPTGTVDHGHALNTDADNDGIVCE